MATFNLITNKILNLNNNIFSYNYDKSDHINGIYKIFFYSLCTGNYKNKFSFLNETLNNFYFCSKEIERNEFIKLFNKIQKYYYILNRFAYFYKFKKSKLIVDNDMQLNKIVEGAQNVICIYHVNSRYLFKIEDLLKMIYMSLTNCFSFFPEPITIKNPYNNISFGKSILYYIYFYLISNAKIKYIKPEYLDIFFKFKESNFNMTKFINCYEYILREYSIKNYLTNTTKSIIKEQILHMISSYNSGLIMNKRIIIDPEFPENELISIMKPYLYLKLESHYSLVGINRTDTKNKLFKKLREFQKFNPIFGKKIIKMKDIIHHGKIKRVKSHIEFNMKHKKFNTYDIENFMNNHLVYKYDANENDYNYNELNNNDNDNENLYTTFTYFMVDVQMLNNNTEDANINVGNEEDDEEEDEYDEEFIEEQHDSELSEEDYDEEHDNDSIS